MSSTTGSFERMASSSGPGEQELLGEDVVLDVGPGVVGVAFRLDPQQLLLVVPLVQRLGLVEALVALESDEPGAGHLGDALGELGLAGSCRALDHDRLVEPVGEVHDAGDAGIGEVVDLGQARADSGDVFEAVGHELFSLFGNRVFVR